MKPEKLASIFREKAVKYRHKKMAKIVKKLHGQQVTPEVTRAVLAPLLRKVPKSGVPMCKMRLKAFASDAIPFVHRYAYRHNARGESILTEEWADALLICYVNYACLPAQLNLTVKGLQA